MRVICWRRLSEEWDQEMGTGLKPRAHSVCYFWRLWRYLAGGFQHPLGEEIRNLSPVPHGF